ncbi:hypothetical protein U9M48_015481 [Paspalum notatum var. saurae]|uniref:Uncharacterized protein n=1 Tax=Paspalum notatum var. saurae TaxID=547442 RepID=A0AAQ3T6M5_PASNO
MATRCILKPATLLGGDRCSTRPGDLCSTRPRPATSALRVSFARHFKVCAYTPRVNQPRSATETTQPKPKRVVLSA